MPDTPLIALLEPLPGLQDLQRLWENLSAVASASFFTSWNWIEAWLLELRVGAVLGKILVLSAIILFLQWRPAGLFAQRGRSLD